MVRYITAEMQWMEGIQGVLYLLIHAILVTNNLDQPKGAVELVEGEWWSPFGKEVWKYVNIFNVFYRNMLLAGMQPQYHWPKMCFDIINLFLFMHKSSVCGLNSNIFVFEMGWGEQPIILSM